MALLCTVRLPMLFIIMTTAFLTLSNVHADDTTTLTTQTPTTMTAYLQTLNSSSSCFPFVLRMTICLDFLVTGSIEPKPSDQCCLRLKWIGELDFPCLCNILAGKKIWGREVNDTRAENLPLSCSLFGSSHDNSLKLCRTKRTVDVAHHAPTPKALVFDPPRLAETDNNADYKQAEVPEPTTAKLKSHARKIGL